MNTVATVTILYPPIQYSKADRGERTTPIQYSKAERGDRTRGGGDAHNIININLHRCKCMCSLSHHIINTTSHTQLVMERISARM